MDGWLEVLTIATALVCGLSAGVFFAFSSFVMQGLGRLEPAAGAAAMQAINVTAVTPPFMTVLFGPGHLVGLVVLTITYHVPRNDALAAVAPAEAGPVWARYQVEWTRMNHVRALAGLAAAAAFTIAVVVA